jgi:glycosyltransferase involved in cell wall biosynthesis
VDLNFHWPPTGGSVVDIKEVACRSQEKGHQVKFFVPFFDRYFPRGVISQPLPIDVETIPFDRKTFNAEDLPIRFKERLRDFSPDLVFVGDGYYMKPILINAIGGEFRTILRIYSHEVLCFRNSMFRTFDVKKGVWNPFTHGPCENHLLQNPKKCYRCLIYGWRLLMFRAVIKSGYRHRLLHSPHEYLAAKTHRSEYVEEVKQCFNYLSDIIVYNQFMADLFKPYHHNIHVVPSGVDDHHFDIPLPENSGPIKTILVPGRLEDRLKGFQVILSAGKILRRYRDDFRILATLPAVTRGLPSYVENVGWWTQDDLPRLYSQADIVVAPVLWQEPFGIIPLEAMSCRRPIIASRTGGHLMTVKDGETGFLFSPGDAHDLAAKISTLLDSRALRIEMGEKGRTRVINEFRWDIIMQKHYQRIFS